MSRGPTDSARQAAQQARRNKRTERIAALQQRTRGLLAEVDEGIRDRATLSHADIYMDCSISRATYFRLRSADDELRDLCDALFRAGRSRRTPDGTHEDVSSGKAQHDDEEIQTLEEQVVNLKQQIAAAKIWIDMLEFERAANQKDIKSKTAGLKAARRQVTQLGSLAHKMHQLLTQHGIDCALDIPDYAEEPNSRGIANNNKDTRPSEPPHLQIVANETPEHPIE